jgi:hypothetical protein
MSKRNSREAKARRRAERAEHRDQMNARELADVRSWADVADMAQRGETLPCGCDAHELLHSPGWHTLDELDG